MEFEAACDATECNAALPYSSPIELVFLSIYICGLAYTAVLIGWIVKFKADMSKIDFEYLLCLCIGAGFLVLSLLFWPLSQNSFYCTIKPIFLAVGTGLMIGTIVAKVFKVWYGFVYLPKQSLSAILKHKRAKLSKYDLRTMVVIVVLVEFVLVLLFLFVPGWTPECSCLRFESGYPIYYTECNLSSGAVFLILGVNAIPVFVGIFLAYKVRRAFMKSGDTLFGKDRKEIDEFTPLGISLLVVFVLGVIATVCSVYSGLTQENASSRAAFYGVRATCSFLAVIIPLSLVFFGRRRAILDNIKASNQGQEKQNKSLKKSNGHTERMTESQTAKETTQATSKVAADEIESGTAATAPAETKSASPAQTNDTEQATTQAQMQKS